MESLLIFLVLGLIAGFLASLVMKGGFGLVGDLIIGVIGAIVGGFLARQLLGIDVTGINVPSILIAFVGAILVIIAVRFIAGHSWHHRASSTRYRRSSNRRRHR